LRRGWQADDAERGLAPFLRSEEKYSTRQKSVLVTNMISGNRVTQGAPG